MFNNVAIDVFIGLVFIYLLYSLLATILQEIIASRLGLRGRMLQKALRRMLEDGIDENVGFWNGTLVGKYISGVLENLRNFFKSPVVANSLLGKFYNSPSIKYLAEGKIFRKPSYLHAHNFSQTIINLLRGNGYDGRSDNESELIRQAINANTLQINPQTLVHLKSLFASARQDTYLFKHKLEDWFEETMDRASGWYKKQTQAFLIIIGLGLAIAFNIDTFEITRILKKDKNARDQMVQLAMSRKNDYAVILDSVNTTVTKTEIKKNDTTTQTFDSLVRATPSDAYLNNTRKKLEDDAKEVENILGIGLNKMTPHQKEHWFITFLGWLVTALALSLGAPFWFDLLDKLIKLRNAGPKPGNMSAIDNASANTTPAKGIKDDHNQDIRG